MTCPRTTVEAQAFYRMYHSYADIPNPWDRLRWCRYGLDLLQKEVAAMVGMEEWLYQDLESGSFPRPLSAREETEAFSALRAGDPAAREKLIRHNLRLVAHIVKKYYALPGDQDDLVSIGTIGLMKAVDTFDSARRPRFSTYASRCIENAILSPAHFGMEKRIHLFHAMTHLRQNGFFGAERVVPFFCFRGCHVRVVA